MVIQQAFLQQQHQQQQQDDSWLAKTMYATRRRKRNARKTTNHTNVSNVKLSPSTRSSTHQNPAAAAAMLPHHPHHMVELIAPNSAAALAAQAQAANGIRSNPSKRHRERLNVELEALADLLPFDSAIVSKLDKLSILRLASSYLKAKCYLRSAAESCPDLAERIPYWIDDPIPTMDGFLLVVTTDGELFYASSNVEMYLGFHQSDILHQSVLELIHSEDRDMFKEQLEWKHRNARHEALSTPRRTPQHGDDFYLQRSFTARFRCLLDNTSGFVTMDVTGRLQPFPPGFPNSLTGGNNLAAASAGIRTRPSPTSSSNNSTATSSTPTNQSPYPSLALFAYCQPFGPGAFPVAAGQVDLTKTFKSKHGLDFSFVNVDPRVRQVIEGADEQDFHQKPFYNIVHLPDLQYVAQAHAELMKRGNCGLLAYRIVNPNSAIGGLIWLQTSARVVHRSNKPDHIICIHRRLTDDEGEGLISKRASEFRLPCALFDAVDAPAVAGQPKLEIGGPIVGQQQQPFHDQLLDQGSNSNSLLHAPPAKRSKPAAKRVSKKAKAALVVDPMANQDLANPQLNSVQPDAVWSTSCYVGTPNYTTANYYGDNLAISNAFNFQPQASQFSNNGNYSSIDYMSYYSQYYQQQQQQQQLQPQSSTEPEFSPCLYSNAGPWPNRASFVTEKFFSQYANNCRMMYDSSLTADQLPAVGTDHQQSPSHSLGTATSDDSPQSTSVIRHTAGFSGAAMAAAAVASGYQSYTDLLAATNYGTPVSGTNNHPSMFQAQQLYAAAPAPQFMS